jgi:hypothetical protein
VWPLTIAPTTGPARAPVPVALTALRCLHIDLRTAQRRERSKQQVGNVFGTKVCTNGAMQDQDAPAGPSFDGAPPSAFDVSLRGSLFPALEAVVCTAGSGGMFGSGGQNECVAIVELKELPELRKFTTCADDTSQASSSIAVQVAACARLDVDAVRAEIGDMLHCVV